MQNRSSYIPVGSIIQDASDKVAAHKAMQRRRIPLQRRTFHSNQSTNLQQNKQASRTCVIVRGASEEGKQLLLDFHSLLSLQRTPNLTLKMSSRHRFGSMREVYKRSKV